MFGYYQLQVRGKADVSSVIALLSNEVEKDNGRRVVSVDVDRHGVSYSIGQARYLDVGMFFDGVDILHGLCSEVVCREKQEFCRIQRA